MAVITKVDNPTKNTIFRIEEVSGNLTYIGQAKIGSATSGAKWQIRKIEKVGSETSILWADGNRRFDNVWDDRAALSYS